MSVRRPLLLPLVPLYAAVLRLKRSPGDQKRLAHPVVSVGSVSAGGAGKTPVVQALATLLLRHGYAVDVLSRGYGRGAKTVERVDPAGSPERFGDEPLLLAQRTGAPVYVGGDRFAAGLQAETDALPGSRLLHLLDDGFQHRQLARNLDIVLLTQQDVEDCLLPAGNLREPLSRLRDADVIVVREEEETALRAVVATFASPCTPIWIIQRQLKLAASAALQRPLAFCAIARPESFFSMLRAKGLISADMVVFRDHHAYRDRDMHRLVEAGRRACADSFVATEKDAVKIPARMREQLEAIGPLLIVELQVAFMDEDAVLTRIRAAEDQPVA